jgi:hypothetical protein
MTYFASLIGIYLYSLIPASDFNFWFKSSDEKILPTQIDFEFTVTHELTHGLGFDPSFSQYSSVFPRSSASENYLAPMPNLSGNVGPKVLGWYPINIFDRFTVDKKTDTPLSVSSDIIQSFSTFYLILTSRNQGTNTVKHVCRAIPSIFETPRRSQKLIQPRDRRL